MISLPSQGSAALTVAAYQQGLRASKRAKTGVSKRRGYYGVARTMGGLLATERKYFDTFKNAYSVTASSDWTGTEADPATLNCLFVPQEGSDINNRVGRKVAVHKLTIRGMISVAAQANQTTTDAATLLRLILVQDLQTNGSQMQGENLMSAPGAADGRLAMNTFQSTANFGRFRVLKDKVISMGNPAISWDGTNMEQQGLSRFFKISYRFKKPVVVHFNSVNGGSVADITDHSFHFLATASTVDLVPVLYYQARTVYTDA